jgi:hypothetical protein
MRLHGTVPTLDDNFLVRTQDKAALETAISTGHKRYISETWAYLRQKCMCTVSVTGKPVGNRFMFSCYLLWEGTGGLGGGNILVKTALSYSHGLLGALEQQRIVFIQLPSAATATVIV